MSPRPQPVFVPGGMGTQMSSSQAEADVLPTLFALAQLYNQFVKGPEDEKKAQQGASQLVNMFGMGQTGGPLRPPEQGATAAPVPDQSGALQTAAPGSMFGQLASVQDQQQPPAQPAQAQQPYQQFNPGLSALADSPWGRDFIKQVGTRLAAKGALGGKGAVVPTGGAFHQVDKNGHVMFYNPQTRTTTDTGILARDVQKAGGGFHMPDPATGTMAYWSPSTGYIDTGIKVPSGMAVKNYTDSQLMQMERSDDPKVAKLGKDLLDEKKQRAVDLGAERYYQELLGRAKGATQIVKQFHMGEQLYKGLRSPSQLGGLWGVPVKDAAIADAMELAAKDGVEYNSQEADANFSYYKSGLAQRVIRRTDSIVAPGGAIDEAIRLAKINKLSPLTKVNELTGKFATQVGESKRIVNYLVNNISAEEQQQIFGYVGGERFLALAQQINNPNLGVKAYLDALSEIKHLIVVRQVANTKGTPSYSYWKKYAEQTAADRPFLTPEEKRASKEDLGSDLPEPDIKGDRVDPWEGMTDEQIREMIGGKNAD